jgi:hypothetical protein
MFISNMAFASRFRCSRTSAAITSTAVDAFSWSDDMMPECWGGIASVQYRCEGRGGVSRPGESAQVRTVEGILSKRSCTIVPLIHVSTSTLDDTSSRDTHGNLIICGEQGHRGGANSNQ